MSAISGSTASLLSGCLEFDKNKRLSAQNLADHPAFNTVRDRVSKLIREV